MSSKKQLRQGIDELADIVGSVVRNEDLWSISDHRWIMIAEQKLQEGFMALKRAVDRPEGF